MEIQSLKKPYRTRTERAQYIVEQYGEFLNGPLLDVGCDKKELQQYLSHPYTGIDVGGTPDIVVNLEEGKLPFDDNAFQCVVCSDVLEHLDTCHAVFDEIMRVTNNIAIISLPNTWQGEFARLLRGKGEKKFYGLPLEPEADRHKWHFNYSDAVEFLKYRAHKNNGKIRKMDVCMHRPNKVMQWLEYLIWGTGDRYRNLFAHAVWAVIEKNGATNT